MQPKKTGTNQNLSEGKKEDFYGESTSVILTASEIKQIKIGDKKETEVIPDKEIVNGISPAKDRKEDGKNLLNKSAVDEEKALLNNNPSKPMEYEELYCKEGRYTERENQKEYAAQKKIIIKGPGTGEKVFYLKKKPFNPMFMDPLTPARRIFNSYSIEEEEKERKESTVKETGKIEAAEKKVQLEVKEKEKQIQLEQKDTIDETDQKIEQEGIIQENLKVLEVAEMAIEIKIEEKSKIVEETDKKEGKIDKPVDKPVEVSCKPMDKPVEVIRKPGMTIIEEREMTSEEEVLNRLSEYQELMEETISELIKQAEKSKKEDPKSHGKICKVQEIFEMICETQDEYIYIKGQDTEEDKEESKVEMYKGKEELAEISKLRRKTEELENKLKQANKREEKLLSTIEARKKVADELCTNKEVMAESVQKLKKNQRVYEEKIERMDKEIKEKDRKNKELSGEIEKKENIFQVAEKERKGIVFKCKILEKTVEALKKEVCALETSLAVYKCKEKTKSYDPSVRSVESLLKESAVYNFQHIQSSMKFGICSEEGSPNSNSILSIGSEEMGENGSNTAQEMTSSDSISAEIERIFCLPDKKRLEKDCQLKDLKKPEIKNKTKTKEKEEKTTAECLNRCNMNIQQCNTSLPDETEGKYCFFRILGLKMDGSKAEVIRGVVGEIFLLEKGHIPLILLLGKNDIQFAIQAKYREKVAKVSKRLLKSVGSEHIQIIRPIDPLIHEDITEEEMFKKIHSSAVAYIKKETKKEQRNEYDLCTAVEKCKSPNDLRRIIKHRVIR